MENKKHSRRLLSLDALRGFDMFFIMGGASLFVALATLWPTSFFQAIVGQMDHVEWNGLTHHDTIFPLFLFIAGISFPFSLEKQREQGMSDAAIGWRWLSCLCRMLEVPDRLRLSFLNQPNRFWGQWPISLSAGDSSISFIVNVSS